MATLSSNVLTLADWAKRLDPDGKTANIVELLSQTNEILEDALFKEGNLPTGERVTVRTGLPTVYWRMINEGVPSSKSTTAQITENTGMLEAWSEVDKDEAILNGNVKEYRASESMAHIEGMSQEMASTLFYGSAASPEEFVGLAPRYSDLSATNAQNILSAGGSGSDNTSIFLVGWGPRSVHGIFPKGSKAGLDHEDLGLVTVETSAGVGGNRMRAYQDHFQWKAGLVVKDWRYVVRIPNIDVSDLAGLTGTQATTAATAIIKLMSRAIDHLPSLSGIKPVFYANRTVLSHLRVMALDKSVNSVTIEEGLNQFGQNIHTTKFLKLPVRLCDTITNAEAAVS